MGATIVRQWLILSMLPAPPRRIGTAAIEAALRERGVRIHRRTIQRDLMELSEIFPIVVDDRGKPYGWRWSTTPSFVRPLLTQPAARMLVGLRARRAALEAMLAHVGIVKVPLATDGHLVKGEALLRDSHDTRRLLLAYADDVEVLSPSALRGEIVERLRRALAAHET